MENNYGIKNECRRFKIELIIAIIVYISNMVPDLLIEIILDHYFPQSSLT